MELKIIQTKKDIITADPSEKFVHLTFRPSLKDILELMNRMPELRLLELAKSYNKTVSKSLIEIFKMKNITLIEASVWGHRTDIEEYIIIPTKKILELSQSGKSVKNIAFETKIDEGMIEYVLKD